MKLIRYTNPQTQAANAFHRLFDLDAPVAGRFGSLLEDFFGAEPSFQRPTVDLYEDDHSYYARFELPGVNKKEVDLELENAVLTVRGSAVAKDANQTSDFQCERSISVPDGVDLEKVTAEMKDGILTVTMPKAEARKPRQINVN